MNQYQTAIAVMAAFGVGVGLRDAEGRPRQFTVEELDALAEFRVPGAGVVGRLAARVAAVGSRMNSRARMRVEPIATPSAEAAARTPA
jgi:hypothetical protein